MRNLELEARMAPQLIGTTMFQRYLPLHLDFVRRTAHECVREGTVTGTPMAGCGYCECRCTWCDVVLPLIAVDIGIGGTCWCDSYRDGLRAITTAATEMPLASARVAVQPASSHIRGSWFDRDSPGGFASRFAALRVATSAVHTAAVPGPVLAVRPTSAFVWEVASPMELLLPGRAPPPL